MSLIGWTLPQTATGRSATVPPPPWHYSGEIIQQGTFKPWPPFVHTRLWPAIDREHPAVHELSIGTVRDVEVGPIWRGTAEIEFGRSEFAELDLLAPRTITAGWVFSMAFSVFGGIAIPLE